MSKPNDIVCLPHPSTARLLKALGLDSQDVAELTVKFEPMGAVTAVATLLLTEPQMEAVINAVEEVCPTPTIVTTGPADG